MKHNLHCVICHHDSGDYRDNPHAWDGWICTPKDICPSCLKLGDKPVAVLMEAVNSERGRKIATLTLLDIQQAGL